MPEQAGQASEADLPSPMHKPRIFRRKDGSCWLVYFNGKQYPLPDWSEALCTLKWMLKDGPYGYAETNYPEEIPQ